jgi:DEAD/DEAH box helicase domain-containing protein
VEELNEKDHCAVVRRGSPDYYTTARDVTQIEVLDSLRHELWGPVEVHFGEVQVTTQVVSFQRKAFVSNEVLGEEPLDLGARDLFTKAVWFSLDNTTLLEGGLLEPQFPGALHAAEHAAIGLLPLVASSDRWDVGGVSTAIHADTGQPTIFVYDGHPGGAGFAERGFEAARTWLKATREAIAACECETGCPSCVQSPKCGNKNNPLDKQGAVLLLDVLLANAASALDANAPSLSDGAPSPGAPLRGAGEPGPVGAAEPGRLGAVEPGRFRGLSGMVQASAGSERNS